jgi:hypothetical protein
MWVQSIRVRRKGRVQNKRGLVFGSVGSKIGGKKMLSNPRRVPS